MVLEFRLARACARGKEERGDSTLEAIEAAYAEVVACARQIGLPLRHMTPVRSDIAAPVPVMR
jgi:hypothetical protein